MARLVIHSGQEGGREILLRPGINGVGRNERNDHPVNDPSVSGFHCEIEFTDGVVSVRDLKSTNGTFIDSVPVIHAVLEPGQTLRLGSVEMLYQAAGSPPASASDSDGGTVRAGIRLAKMPAELPPPIVTPTVEPPAIAPRGLNDCVHHPGVPATLICQQCASLFCKQCVKTIHAGARDAHSCLACGGMCVNLAQHRKAVAKQQATFGRMLAGAFKYPFQQNGPVILFSGALFFAALDFARWVLWRVAGFLLLTFWLTLIMSVGYLFAYMQNVIRSSSNGEDYPPGWPEISGFWDDVVVPFWHFISIFALYLGPGFVAMVFIAPAVGWGLVLLGLLCLPMALLTVSLAGGLGGLNPLIIFSSIGKIPASYLIVCIMMLVIAAMETLCDKMLSGAAIYILPAIIGKFITLYGLTVEMRILGLLYFRNKEKLSWFK